MCECGGFILYAQTEDNDSDSDGISNGLSFGGGGANAGNNSTQTTTSTSTTRAPFSFTRPTPASSNPELPGLGIGDAMNAIGRMEELGKLKDLFLRVYLLLLN